MNLKKYFVMAALVRNLENKVLFGVCAGVAEHFGWNVSTLRLLWFVLAFVGLGSPVLFYIILLIVMPAQKKKDYAERMNERLGRK